MLFLDCDSFVMRDDFLQTYVDAIKDVPGGVICGGREYEPTCPSKQQRLRWKYGIKKESKSVEERKRYAYRSFMTNNFVVNKEILQRVRFDERLSGYGHEDTLFGLAMQKQSIPLMHIDNPILNGHMETNSEYLQHTAVAIENLVKILGYSFGDRELIEDVSLLRVFYRLHKFRWLIWFSFFVTRSFMHYVLSKGYAFLWLFDFYKLGLLEKELRKQAVQKQ